MTPLCRNALLRATFPLLLHAALTLFHMIGTRGVEGSELNATFGPYSCGTILEGEGCERPGDCSTYNHPVRQSLNQSDTESDLLALERDCVDLVISPTDVNTKGLGEDLARTEASRQIVRAAEATIATLTDVITKIMTQRPSRSKKAGMHAMDQKFARNEESLPGSMWSDADSTVTAQYEVRAKLTDQASSSSRYRIEVGAARPKGQGRKSDYGRGTAGYKGRQRNHSLPPGLTAEALIEAGKSHGAQNQPQLALDNLKGALDLLKATKGYECADVANVLFFIGQAHSDMEQYQEAVIAFDESYLIYRKTSESSGYNRHIGATLCNLGMAHMQIDSNEKMIEYFEESLLNYRATLAPGEHEADIPFMLYRLGGAYEQLGKYAESRRVYIEYVSYFRTTTERSGGRITLDDLDDPRTRPEDSPDSDEQLFDLREELNVRLSQSNEVDDRDFDLYTADLLMLIGEIHIQRAEYLDARESLAEALRIYVVHRSHAEEIDIAAASRAFMELSYSCLHLGEFDNSILTFERALDLHQRDKVKEPTKDSILFDIGKLENEVISLSKRI